MPNGLVEHLEFLGKNDPRPEADDPSAPEAPPLQPSEILQAWLDNKSFDHEGLDYLRRGDCGPAFYVLGMGFDVGAQFQRVITKGRPDLTKLINDLASKGY